MLTEHGWLNNMDEKHGDGMPAPAGSGLVIPLKKMLRTRLRPWLFLIQCKKVQLSGEKCLQQGIRSQKEGVHVVSRGVIAESGCERAVVRADPAPRRAQRHLVRPVDDHQTSAWLPDAVSTPRMGEIP